MIKAFKIGFLLAMIPFFIFAQNDTIQYNVSLLGIGSSGHNSPFWFQNNQYGKNASNPNSGNLLLAFHKDFSNNTKKLFDYSFKGSILLQASSKTNIYIHELYAKSRFAFIDLTIGAREEYLGNQDSTLSSGGLLFSHNARPMPKITVGVENFMAVPYTKGFVEFKGAFAHGWFTDNVYVKNIFLHHKYLYGRIGGKLPIRLQYGFDHVAQWGGNSPDPQIGKQPSAILDYLNICLGKSGGDDANISDRINTLGNHIISQSMKLELDLADFRINGYWQNISEDKPLRLIWNSINRPDGLWGVSIRNKRIPFIKGILYEYLCTADQSGPYHDKDGMVYGGGDSYFTNGIYTSGWSYFARTIGTPFITSPSYNKNGEICTLNNRVQVHHFGLEGEVADYKYRVLSSFSKNYGTYSLPTKKEDIKTTSVLVEIKKQFPKLQNIECGLSMAADFGKYYGNSTGCMISIRKSGNLFRY